MQRVVERLKTVLSVAVVIMALLKPVIAQATPRITSPSQIRQAYQALDDKLHITWKASSGASLYRVIVSDAVGNKIKSVITRRSDVKLNAKLFSDGAVYLLSLQTLSNSSFAASKIKINSFTYSTRVKTAEIFADFKSQNASGRKGVYFLPKNYRLKTLPIMLLFHGSSIDGRKIANIFKKLAQQKEFIIVAPDSFSEIGWEIETGNAAPTADQIHIADCLAEIKALPHISLDANRFLVAGVSAGGEVAGFFGSNNSQYTKIAVLHGGVDLPSLGSNKIPVWLSTGSIDTLRPPEELKYYQSRLPDFGFTDVSYHEYSVAHDVPLEEREALLEWWLQ